MGDSELTAEELVALARLDPDDPAHAQALREIRTALMVKSVVERLREREMPSPDA